MKIIIWTGDAWEEWSPGTAATEGLGGSEIAAINVAEQLALRGHEVEIWGRVREGLFNNVRYHEPLGMERPRCDVFVSSREINAAVGLEVSVGLKVLWLHDYFPGPDCASNMRAYDLILSVSEWAREQHQKFYPHVGSERFVATRNGIDPRRFLREGEDASDPQPVVKAGCRIVYSSSPDRGLSRLLDLWPRIRELIPEAELDVYYGFANWSRGAELDGDRDLVRVIEYLRHRLDVMRPQGVYYWGRVGQVELAQKLMASRLWLYPTNFLETSCIAAMEAQAAGAYPIVSSRGALPETIASGSFVDSTLHGDAYDRSFLRHVQKFVEDPGWVEAVVDLNRRRMLGMSWSGVAEQWEKLFLERGSVSRASR